LVFRKKKRRRNKSAAGPSPLTPSYRACERKKAKLDWGKRLSIKLNWGTARVPRGERENLGIIGGRLAVTVGRGAGVGPQTLKEALFSAAEKRVKKNKTVYKGGNGGKTAITKGRTVRPRPRQIQKRKKCEKNRTRALGTNRDRGTFVERGKEKKAAERKRFQTNRKGGGRPQGPEKDSARPRKLGTREPLETSKGKTHQAPKRVGGAEGKCPLHSEKGVPWNFPHPKKPGRSNQEEISGRGGGKTHRRETPAEHQGKSPEKHGRP